MMYNAKRLLFVLLLVVCIVGIAATVWFLFLNKKLPTLPVTQNPAPVATLPDTRTIPTPQPATSAPEKVTPPPADSPAELERKAREALFRRARDLTSRLGSYGNADDFAAFSDLSLDVTPEVQTYLNELRTSLRAAHAVRGTSFALTTRALAARLTQDVAVLTAQEVEVTVDTQQRTEEGTTEATVVRQAMLKLVKVGADWNVSRVTWQDPQK